MKGERERESLMVERKSNIGVVKYRLRRKLATVRIS